MVPVSVRVCEAAMQTFPELVSFSRWPLFLHRRWGETEDIRSGQLYPLVAEPYFLVRIICLPISGHTFLAFPLGLGVCVPYT